MISKQLLAEIDTYAADMRRTSRLLARARAGAVSTETVGRYLASIHYLVSHTPIHLRLAHARARSLGHLALADYFVRKLEEEVGHDRWAEADMAAVGKLSGRTVLREPSLPMRELVKSIARGIERDPFVYLSYILFAEYLTVKVGPEWVAALEQRCGVPSSALTVTTNHTELDKEHVEEGRREIDELVTETRLHGPMIEMLHESMHRFTLFCDDLCEAVAA